MAWEDHSTGFGNLILSASYDGGQTWSAPIQINDNVNPNIDAVQPNLTAAADGTVVASKAPSYREECGLEAGFAPAAPTASIFCLPAWWLETFNKSQQREREQRREAPRCNQ